MESRKGSRSPCSSTLAGSAVTDGAMMFIYFGFILLIAFNKPLMGSLVLPGLSLALVRCLVIVSAWVLIYIYVRWATTAMTRKSLNLKR